MKTGYYVAKPEDADIQPVYFSEKRDAVQVIGKNGWFSADDWTLLYEIDDLVHALDINGVKE